MLVRIYGEVREYLRRPSVTIYPDAGVQLASPNEIALHMATVVSDFHLVNDKTVAMQNVGGMCALVAPFVLRIKNLNTR